jgi:hypothetical protein
MSVLVPFPTSFILGGKWALVTGEGGKWALVMENLSAAVMVCKFIQKLNTSKSLDSPAPCAIRGSTTYGILGDIFLATTAP